MTFFNRKEEVLDVELTQYGKFLLSKGKWRPEYYAFFDDDVVYDTAWAPGEPTELQNISESRIKETARSHTQHVFHSVGADHQNWNAHLQELEDYTTYEEKLLIINYALQQRPDKHFVNAAPLGTAQIGNQQAPAWNITFLKGAVSSSFMVSTGSTRPMVNIPQINAEIKYQSAVGDQFSSPFEPNPYSDESHTLPEFDEDDEARGGFSDGTFIQVKEDFILLDIEETNGLTKNKDFEIEVFKVETVERPGLPDEEILLPLTFIDSGLTSQYEITEDDVLVKKDSNRSVPFDVEVSDRNVSYYLGLNTDAEIDDRIICDLDPLAKKRSIFSAKFADCEDLEENQREDIYGAEEEFEDPCEE